MSRPTVNAYVQTYRGWLKHGRQVRKGERAYKGNSTSPTPMSLMTNQMQKTRNATPHGPLHLNKQTGIATGRSRLITKPASCG
jgi:hypothetical protein